MGGIGRYVKLEYDTASLPEYEHHTLSMRQSYTFLQNISEERQMTKSLVD